MSVWAAYADVHGGIWGASRHALTVGFAATMVFAIGPRILPHFAGRFRVSSASASCFSCGVCYVFRLAACCAFPQSLLPMKVWVSFAWKVQPVSGILELSGVLLFAANQALTFLIGRSAFAVNSSEVNERQCSCARPST